MARGRRGALRIIARLLMAVVMLVALLPWDDILAAVTP